MKIFIIDDEKNICLTLQSILEDEGYNCGYSLSGKEGLDKIIDIVPDVVLLDVRLDDANGLDILREIKKINETIAVIMISGHSGITEAVKAIKLGAYEFLEKPLTLSKVKIVVRNAYQYQSISRNYNRLKSLKDERYKLVGSGPKMQKLKEMIAKIAPTDSKVLIRGESGTGKELIAYAIHHNSHRSEEPFIKFNSAAIPDELIESELFGHEKGAFTGAHKNKQGKLEMADEGTLFLDEIGDMSLKAQAKILRVMQEGEFERVGSNKTQKIDTRIIAATHKNLEKLVEENRFREDLFYRLNVIPIESPALREHPEDIEALVKHFSKLFAKEMNIPEKIFDKKALRFLQNKSYKGNVRELRNFIERIYILITDNRITPEEMKSLELKESETDFWNETKNFTDKKKEFEIKYLTTQLRLNNGNITNTAKSLGLQSSNLSRKLKKLNIN